MCKQKPIQGTMILGVFISSGKFYSRIILEKLEELDHEEKWPPDFEIYFENLQGSKTFRNMK